MAESETPSSPSLSEPESLVSISSAGSKRKRRLSESDTLPGNSKRLRPTIHPSKGSLLRSVSDPTTEIVHPPSPCPSTPSLSSASSEDCSSVMSSPLSLSQDFPDEVYESYPDEAVPQFDLGMWFAGNDPGHIEQPDLAFADVQLNLEFTELVADRLATVEKEADFVNLSCEPPSKRLSSAIRKTVSSRYDLFATGTVEGKSHRRRVAPQKATSRHFDEDSSKLTELAYVAVEALERGLSTVEAIPA
jgi:hypothetical protein